MSPSTTFQAVASLAFVVLAIVFLNPFHLFMTDMLHMLILGLCVAAFGVVATLIVREQGGDERDVAHRMLASRAAFLVGASILLCGMVWQAFHGIVDGWLIGALCGMVLAKVLVRLYGEQQL